MSYEGTNVNIAWALYRYGWTLQTFGFHYRALDILEQGKEKFHELGEIRHVALCDFQIAHALSALGNYEEVDSIYLKLREAFNSLGMEESNLLSEVNRPVNFNRRGDFWISKQIYESILEKLSKDKFAFIYRGVIVRLIDTLNAMEFYSDSLRRIETVNEFDFGDDRLVRLNFQNTRALALVGNNRLSAGESTLKEILSMELSQGFEAAYAQAMETLSLITHIKGDEKEMLNLRGKAIAYYLAGDRHFRYSETC